MYANEINELLINIERNKKVYKAQANTKNI